jgi:hypothetical protein
MHVFVYYNSKSIHQGIKNNAINPLSLRCMKDNETYFEVIKRKKLIAKATNTFNCIFCGEKLSDEDCDPHHINGRDGDMLTDDKYLTLSHRFCHTKYHSSTFVQLEKEVWFKVFLWRLKGIDETLYDKEINKQFKT